MPYIAIKAYPKDAQTKERFVEKLNDLLLEVWGCPQEAITISLEEIAREDWQAQVFKPEIEPKMDKMVILSGKKRGQP